MEAHPIDTGRSYNCLSRISYKGQPSFYSRKTKILVLLGCAVPSIVLFSETGRRETGKRKWERKGGRETERKEMREEREREGREKEVWKERGSKKEKKNHSISQTLPDFEDQPTGQLRSVVLEVHFFTQV